MPTLFAPGQLQALTFFTGAIHLGIGTLLWLVWRTRRTGPGFGNWVLTEWCMGLAWLLVLVQAVAPQQWLPVLYTLLLLLAPAFYEQGLRRFFLRPPAWHPQQSLLFALLFTLLYAVAVAQGANLHQRIVVFTALQLPLLASIVRQLWLITHERPAYRILWLLLAALCLQITAQSLRIVEHLQSPSLPEVSSNNPLADHTVGMVLLFSVVFSLLRSSVDLISVQIRTEQALQTTLQQLEQRANFDGLTGLATRQYMESALPALQQRCLRHEEQLTLILFDLDEFKQINDNYGHPVGDAILAAMGACVREHCRGDDLPVRIGGDEIALLVYGGRPDQLASLLQRLRHAIRAACSGLVEQPVTLSIGIAYFQDAEPFAPVYRRADQAMYSAKRNGRNCAYVHTPESTPTQLELGHLPATGMPLTA
ncbi:GGDEF domain-containing protein [Chitinilyticum piscinae]|uniref:diguanylate cyclase n=1 Tax=Chitinilyticum piscinae TaxID=2866724 RepID=A0A8J7KGK9_9NEIS|nr:GGDEF domain-containing protein [Chitinilyticum piscinae]MBE9610479.1 GGDEF domain-containing protein [Chitinilyticum piscinae]